MDTTGIAALDELDALLTRDDFEGGVDVELLDAAEDALLRARAVVASLEALRAHLAAGSMHLETTIGLSVDARIAVESLEAFTAGVLG